MRVYTVHMQSKSYSPLETTVLVPEGFSWMALIFNVFWLLYRRAWLPFAAIAGGMVISALLQRLHMINSEMEMMLDVVLAVITGCYGSDWYRQALSKRGYVLTDVVADNDRNKAEMRLYEQYVADSAAAADVKEKAEA